MATSSGSSSLDTSANSHHSLFTFSSHRFSDLLSSDHRQPPLTHPRRPLADRTGSGIPKFKSLPPPSLPISPPAVSPSSYFAISPAELLDSPVLLTSNILPSPTTGSFPARAFNWSSNSNQPQFRQNVKQEDDKSSYSDFSFHPPTTGWSYQEAAVAKKKQNDGGFSGGGNSTQSFSPPDHVVATIQPNNNNNSSGYQSVREQRRTEDGYNWRKYGQKQVKGSENPRSYYKCTFPNCPTKKKVEKSLADGQVTEIVYKGSHNHPKPQSATRRNSASASASTTTNSVHSQDHSLGQIETPENSSISDDFDSHRIDHHNRSSTGRGEIEEDELPDAKRWRGEGEMMMINEGSKTVREPRVVVQTTSDIDILDDGYRWRKYGQKVVKGNPNPRSYYKCTYVGCPVRKHVERASHDLRAVITTYEGKHNHDVPAARGSGASRAAAGYQGSMGMVVQEQGRFGFSAASYGGEQSGDGIGSVFNGTQDESLLC